MKNKELRDCRVECSKSKTWKVIISKEFHITCEDAQVAQEQSLNLFLQSVSEYPHCHLDIKTTKLINKSKVKISELYKEKFG